MHRNPRRSLVCSTLALALGLAPSLPVLAATTVTAEPGGDAAADPEALSAEAIGKFEAKEYDSAIELFEQAYAIDPQPNYLFNIGRVYEEKGDLQNAVVHYQKFLAQPGVDLESRQAATERLKVLREALDQIKSDEAKPPDEVQDPPPDEVQDPPPDETPDPIVENPPPDDGEEAAQKRKKTLRITGYSLMGLGGGVVIAGAIVGSIASGTADEAEADMYVDRKIALRDRARRQARAADALFITGGVLAVAGVALVLATVGGKKKSSDGDAVARRTRWEPVIGPRQVGLGLTHRF